MQIAGGVIAGAIVMLVAAGWGLRRMALAFLRGSKRPRPPMRGWE